MDALTSALLQNFQDSLLAPLADHLRRLTNAPPEERAPDQTLAQVVEESLAVMQALRAWCLGSEEPVEHISPLDDLQQNQDLVTDFLDHADELMERVGIDLAMLNKHINDEKALEEIFRAMHTLKGVAGMFGFQQIALVAHHCETALSVLRDRAVAVSPDHVQKFYQVHDRICAMLDQIRGQESITVDPHEIVAELGGPSISNERDETSQPIETADESSSSEDSHRIDAACLDRLMTLMDELNADKSRLRNVETEIRTAHPNTYTKTHFAEHLRLFDRHIDDLQTFFVQLRMIPIFHVFKKCQRVVREITRETGKPIHLFIAGEDTRLDRTIVERLTEPLVHLLRNACDHGIESPEARAAAGKPESGKITIAARRKGNAVVISVSDDGAGLDVKKIEEAAANKGLLAAGRSLSQAETQDLIFCPGLSTADKITKISGRGIGMDVVKARIIEMEGSISIESHSGQGTTFHLHVPLTLAVQNSILVDADNQVFAVPVAAVHRSMSVVAREIQRIGHTDRYRHDDRTIPLVRLSDLMQTRPVEDRRPLSDQQATHHHALIMNHGDRRYGLVVDRIIANEDLVIKPLSPLLGQTRFVSGGTVLGNGQIAIMIDPPSIEEEIRAQVDAWEDAK